MRLLLLLARSLLICKLLATLDDGRARAEELSLFTDVRLEGGKGQGARGNCRGDGRALGSNHIERRVEGSRETGEVRAQERCGRGLQVVLRGGRNGRGVRSEKVLVELDRARRVVDSDVQVTTATRLGDETLDTLARDLLLAVLDKPSELDHAVDLERGVHLRELLEQTSKDDLFERLDVARRLGLGGERGEDGLDFGGDGEGVEVDLEDGVQRTELRADALEDVSVELCVRSALYDCA